MNATHKDLKRAIELIEKVESPNVSQDPWRLGFHLMPPVGWLNDPNGLCQYKGKYHVFFQYSPFNPQGGIKVWGHYTSSNMIDWQYEGAPILTDQPDDCHGVYSGCALVEEEGVSLFYTGNVKLLGDYDYTYTGRQANTLLVESEDMMHFSEKKCIMTNKDYGDDQSCHVRDPKVWKENGSYYMVQGARTKEDKGEVLVFKSKDKLNWQRIGKLTTPEKFGYMWECPDLFKLDGKTILSISPQGVEKQGLEYWNVYQSGYYIVKGDFKGKYELGQFTELDRGFDFYAPQTFEDEDGRRILIGWMGLPDCEEEYTNPTVEKGWQHCLTLPRQLTIKEGKLYQNPVKELESLRKDKTEASISGQTKLTGYALQEVKIDQIDDREGFECILNEDIALTYSKEEGILTMSFLNDSGAGRTKRAVLLASLHSLRVFCDHSAIEVFVNDGEEVFSTRYYPKQKERTIVIKCKLAAAAAWKLGEMTYGIK